MTEVRFTGVTKTYGAQAALDDVSMVMPAGQFTTVLGPSGSGKTTMLSLIAGITDVTAGRIQIGARDVTHALSSERNTGLVFQSYALFPHMTIFDNIAFPLRLRKVSGTDLTARVNEALRMVRLEGYGARKPDQLSGGQQQRVALARAIVFKPDILLLDEPLAALDRNLRQEVRMEIRALQRELGITTVMVTHDQEEAMSLSDRVILLSKGRVEQVGPPDTMYHRPATRFAAGFLGTANFLDGQWQGGMIRAANGECYAAQADGTAEGSQVTGVLRPEALRFVAGGGMAHGRVIDVDFLGEVVRYGVRTPGGQVLRVHVSGLHDRHKDGDIVHLSWDPGRVWLLPDASRPTPDPEADRVLSQQHLPLQQKG
jgi:putative spermidine/putrescine transport system ATP-binding protein